MERDDAVIEQHDECALTILDGSIEPHLEEADLLIHVVHQTANVLDTLHLTRGQRDL